jgi:modulator of FtsH protease HflK
LTGLEPSFLSIGGCVDNLNPLLQRFLSSLPVSPLTVLLFIAFLTGVMMSFYTIPAESEGIVLRFGKFIDKVPSGLHTKLPFGVDDVITVPTQRQQKLEFGVSHPWFYQPRPNQ